MRVDAKSLRDRTDIVAVIGERVELRRRGSEFEALCPFHMERTPSFRVVPNKGFFHCFGCGAHGDVISFVARFDGVEFMEACKRLGQEFLPHDTHQRPKPKPRPMQSWKAVEANFVPLIPVPDTAIDLVVGGLAKVWNAKKGKWSALRPSRVDEYRDARGRLMGAVLRLDIVDNGRPAKITPQVTWCVGPDGRQHWTICPFPAPRPICGLDALARFPEAPVLVVEGEKCRAIGQQCLPRMPVITWPGGSKGIRYVDWAPLRGRNIVLWPDADLAGQQAMLGHTDYAGTWHDGVAQYALRAGVESIRLIEVDDKPKGWDLADAMLEDKWTRPQLDAWVKSRTVRVEFKDG